MVVSGVVGYLTVKFFLRYLVNHTFDVFAAYRLALAAVTVAWLVSASAELPWSSGFAAGSSRGSS